MRPSCDTQAGDSERQIVLNSETRVFAIQAIRRAIRDELGWSFFPGFIKTPTAIADFPKDYPMGRPTLETAGRGYNVVCYSQMPRGGHSAALEQPELFVDDLRAALRPFH